MQEIADCKSGSTRHRSSMRWPQLLLIAAVAASAGLGCGGEDELDVAEAAQAVTSTTTADVDGYYASPREEVWGYSRGGAGFDTTKLTRPGLTQFNLKFAFGDHHIKTIAAGHFFEHTTVDWDLATHVLQDNSRTDDFFFSQENRQLPPGTYFCQDDIGSADARTRCEAGLPNDRSNYTRVLTGFLYAFRSDAHLESIALNPCRDDTWCGWMLGPSTHWDWSKFRLVPSVWAVRAVTSYAYVPNRYVKSRGVAGGRSRGSWGSALIKAKNPVLAGFDFEYANGDHHLKEIGIQLNPGWVDVTFADQGGGDDFIWHVHYVDLAFDSN